MPSSPRSTPRSHRFTEEVALADAMAKHGQRFCRRANVVAVGVGVAYRERSGTFAVGDTHGARLPLAIKAIVTRKLKRLAARDRLPRTVRIRVKQDGRTRDVR